MSKKVLVLGLGREGKNVIEFLSERYPGSTFAAFDEHSSHNIAGVTIYNSCSELPPTNTFDLIVRSPGFPPKRIPLPAETEVTSATAIFLASAPGKIIGISGTKGKSTTSSLIAAMLQQRYADVRLGGNIGIPMLSLLAGATKDTVFVLELSSYQLCDLTKSPHIAVLLNIVPEHLDFHGSFEAYLRAKGNICRYQRAEGTVIYNPQYTAPHSLAQESLAQQLHYTTGSHATASVIFKDGSIFVRSTSDLQQLVSQAEIPLRGEGNIQNVLAATTCALSLAVPTAAIREAILQFKPLEHRLEIVGTWCGIRFVNDSLSTIPEALVNALGAFASDVETVIAGGYDRGLDYSAIAPALERSQVKNLILFPTTGEKIYTSLVKHGLQERFAVKHVTSMDEAIRHAYQVTSPGKTCLLSPAASSFNLFRDYRERGEAFRRLVQQLGQESST